jgi:hypothetical protein
MKLHQWYFPLLILLLLSCGPSKEQQWETIKASNKVYPLDSILITKDSTEFTGNQITWINNSYRKYLYKEFCPSYIEATFNHQDSTVSAIYNRDSLGVAKKLLAEFRKTGVAHFVAQRSNRKELKVYLYTEKGLNPIMLLRNFEIPSSSLMMEEEQWDSYYSFWKIKF